MYAGCSQCPAFLVNFRNGAYSNTFFSSKLLEAIHRATNTAGTGTKEVQARASPVSKHRDREHYGTDKQASDAIEVPVTHTEMIGKHIQVCAHHRK